eukprot:2084339-Alexandrium_andersonii.AAC.1
MAAIREAELLARRRERRRAASCDLGSGHSSSPDSDPDSDGTEGGADPGDDSGPLVEQPALG